MNKDLIRYKGTVRLGENPGWGIEYWTEEDWQEHREYVKDLKEKGDYLKEVDVTIDLVSCPLFDKKFNNSNSGSAKAIILDMTQKIGGKRGRLCHKCGNIVINCTCNKNVSEFINMKDILDKVTEEQLEVSKKLGEIKDTLKRWSTMTKDKKEKNFLSTLSEQMESLEEAYDDWMLGDN